jgi:hypothetical protein
MSKRLSRDERDDLREMCAGLDLPQELSSEEVRALLDAADERDRYEAMLRESVQVAEYGDWSARKRCRFISNHIRYALGEGGE